MHSSDLVVASPVEDYFIHIDDLPDDKKVCLMVALILSCKMFTLALTWLFLNLKCNVPQEEAEKATAPFLDALDDDYAVPCDGMCNLFLSSYSFQSTAMCFFLSVQH